MGIWLVGFRRRPQENAEASVFSCDRASSWTSKQPPATCGADRRVTWASKDPANPCPILIEFICPTHEAVDAEAITGDVSALARQRICDWSMLSRLDSHSRAVLNGFARRLCLAVWLVLLCCYMQRWSYQHALGLFQLMCTAAAFGSMVLALWKHEIANADFMGRGDGVQCPQPAHARPRQTHALTPLAWTRPSPVSILAPGVGRACWPCRITSPSLPGGQPRDQFSAQSRIHDEIGDRRPEIMPRSETPEHLQQTRFRDRRSDA